MNADKEKDLIEKINRLEEKIDQRFFNDTKSVMPSTPLLFGFMIAG